MASYSTSHLVVMFLNAVHMFYLFFFTTYVFSSLGALAALCSSMNTWVNNGWTGQLAQDYWVPVQDLHVIYVGKVAFLDYWCLLWKQIWFKQHLQQHRLRGWDTVHATLESKFSCSCLSCTTNELYDLSQTSNLPMLPESRRNRCAVWKIEKDTGKSPEPVTEQVFSKEIQNPPTSQP